MNQDYKVICPTHHVPMVRAGLTPENAQRFVCVAGGCVKEVGFGVICRLCGTYGFIDNGTGRNIFFHISELPPGLQPYVGLLVKFEVGRSAKGPVAIRIEPRNPF